MFHRIAIWRVFVTLDFSTFSTKSGGFGPFADTCADGEVAPIPAVRGATGNRRESTRCGSSSRSTRTTGDVQGFGYRPVDDLSASAEGRCPKAFREGTRGVRRAACRLWGFDGAAAWARVR